MPTKKTTTKKKPAARPGLSGWFVMWRHTMDDVPIAFCPDMKSAQRLAETITFEDCYKIANTLGIDCSTPVCFAIVKFERGRAVSIESVSRDDDAV